MIPYRPFPTIDLGRLSLHTFGLVHPAGVLMALHLLQVYGRDNGLDLASLARPTTRLGLVCLRSGDRALRPTGERSEHPGEPARRIRGSH